MESVALATIRQFFFPILKGSLEVELHFEDEKVVLTKDTLQKEVKELDFSKLPIDEIPDKDQLLSLFEMTKWILEHPEANHIRLQHTTPTNAYRWTKELFKDIDLQELQIAFEQGKPLAFCITVKHQPEGETPELLNFNAYIQKDLSLLEPESIFIRDALTITGVKSLKRKGTRGIVIISDKKLVTFFGQAEGPAHTGWHKDNFRVKYENAGEIISFVQRSLQELYNKLQAPTQGLDKALLSDLFFINLPDEDQGDKGGKNKGNKKEKDHDFDPPPKVFRKYNLSQVEGENGFKITNNNENEQPVDTFSVKLAYDRPDGKPFAKYSGLDFNVKNLTISKTNVQIEQLDRNSVVFKPTDQQFELKVTGFDPNRDLIIDVNHITV
ncbi:MAG: hypothetical protein EOP48_26290 [Sphingobacteriales bacterium]|nr:MAG: hypothetical protein EOP48_26290 [Sphingobacteriales bacterium]